MRANATKRTERHEKFQQTARESKAECGREAWNERTMTQPAAAAEMDAFDSVSRADAQWVLSLSV